MQAKVPETCLLTVRVLQASGLPSKDLVTSSDCYVTLNLPTASSHTLQTRTVKNSRNPVWNQNFHFRIHRQLKNVMELKVFDHDLVTKDDPVLSVLFDVGTLQIGTQRQSFSLGTQVKLRKVGVPSAGAGASEPPLLQGGPGISSDFTKEQSCL